jgi:hypothetical protein
VIVEPEEEKESDNVSRIADATLNIQNRLISARPAGKDEV